MAFETCVDVNAGIGIIKCIVVQANYVPIVLGLIVLGGILFFRMNAEPTRDRIAVTMFVMSVFAFLFSILELLPKDQWIVYMVLAVGSIIILSFNR